MPATSGPSFAPTGTDLPDDIVEIGTYPVAVEVFRSQQFQTELSDGTDAIRYGTVLRLSAPEHPRRRRSLNRVLQHQNPQWFIDTFLEPAVSSELRLLTEQSDDGGPTSADLVQLLPKVSISLAAAMIGIEVAGPDSLDELNELVRAFREMAGVRWIVDARSKEAAVRRAVEAKQKFDDRYFRPALHEHRELLARRSAGRYDEELPPDFLTLVAAHLDPNAEDVLGKHVDTSLADRDMALREAITSYIIGAVDTTTIVVTWCVHELTRWFARHPEDAIRRTEPDFLYQALAETLRLHPTNPATMRIATEDVTLSDGTHVSAGQMVAVLTGQAGRDPAVYGPDADGFSLRRELPHGVLPYGLAFGSGAHMCYGLPLVLGTSGADGSLVRILTMLYQAGMQADSSRAPELIPGTYKEQFASYPVVFERAAGDA